MACDLARTSAPFNRSLSPFIASIPWWSGQRMRVTGLLIVPIGSRSRVFEEAQQGDRPTNVLPVGHFVDGVGKARWDREGHRCRATLRCIEPASVPAGGTDECIKTSVVYLSPHKLPEKGAGTGPPFVAGVPTADDPTLSGKWPAVARDVPAWRVPWSPIGPRGSPHVGPHDESWQIKPSVQQPSPQPVPRQTH
jgi:hypothetical protein